MHRDETRTEQTSQSIGHLRRLRGAGLALAAVTVLGLRSNVAKADGDLITIIDNLQHISGEDFTNSLDVGDGCITSGIHKVLRFNFTARNVGDGAIVAGKPPSAPCSQCPCPATSSPPFVWSNGHCHWHLKDYNTFQLTTPNGVPVVNGLKQAFCLMDFAKWDPNNGPAQSHYYCGDMGISVGYQDTYDWNLGCQYIKMDGITDGDYRIIGATNSIALSTEANIHNNAVNVPIRISGTTVTNISAAWQPRTNTASSGAGYFPPTLASWGPNRLDEFHTNLADGHLKHHWKQDGSAWSAVDDLGTPAGVTLTSWPSAVAWGRDRLDIFVRGSDNRLWHKPWDTNTWYAWDNPGGAGNMAGAPRVASWGPKRLDIAYADTSGNLRHIGWSGTNWGPVDNLGHPSGVTFNDQPSIVAWGANRLDFFIVGSDHRLWHLAWTGNGFTGWDNPGGVSTASFHADAVSWGPNRLDVFWAGTSNAIQHIGFGGGGWGPIDTFAAPQYVTVNGSMPSAVAWGPNRLDWFVRGSDGKLWHGYWDGSFHYWDAPYIDTDLASSPAAISWARNQLSIVFGNQAAGLGGGSWF